MSGPRLPWFLWSFLHSLTVDRSPVLCLESAHSHVCSAWVTMFQPWVSTFSDTNSLPPETAYFLHLVCEISYTETKPVSLQHAVTGPNRPSPKIFIFLPYDSPSINWRAFFLVNFHSPLPILLFPGYTSGYLYGPVLNVLSISVTLLRLPISKHRSLHLHEPLPALVNALCMSPNLLCSETGRKVSSLTSLPPFINS